MNLHMPQCPDCGSSIDINSIFCSNCGARLTSKFPSTNSSPSQSNVKKQLQKIDDYDFEHFIAELWEQQGWKTTVSQKSVDSGVDVAAIKQAPYPQKTLIQAKRYAEGNNVSSTAIQQYASLKYQQDNVDTVIVVTTSSFTREAEKRAEELNVKLVDGDGLVSLIQENEFDTILHKYTRDEFYPVEQLSLNQKRSIVTYANQMSEINNDFDFEYTFSLFARYSYTVSDIIRGNSSKTNDYFKYKNELLQKTVDSQDAVTQMRNISTDSIPNTLARDHSEFIMLWEQWSVETKNIIQETDELLADDYSPNDIKGDQSVKVNNLWEDCKYTIKSIRNKVEIMTDKLNTYKESLAE